MHRTALLSLLFCIALSQPIQSQAAPVPDWLSTEAADALIESKDWINAESLLDQIANRLQNDNRTRTYHSARIGSIYFKKGFCELQQEKWTEAMTSFENCYKKYQSTKDDPNPYHTESLRYWADAASGAKELELAVRLYQKYLAETHPRSPNHK